MITHVLLVKLAALVVTLALTVHVRVLATAYCQRGRTATGTFVRHGTVAVDPDFIPLGTRLFIPGYGWGRARDTGGLIHGARIDVWMRSCTRAIKWGARRLTVEVSR